MIRGRPSMMYGCGKEFLDPGVETFSFTFG